MTEDRVDGIQSHDKDLAAIVFLYLEIPSSMQLLLCMRYMYISLLLYSFCCYDFCCIFHHIVFDIDRRTSTILTSKT